MDFWRMVNPLVGYRWIQTQLEKRRFKCTVTINKPKMKIMGKLKNHKTNPDHIISFLGIPYAQPPVEELRFQPPQPLPEEDSCQFIPELSAYDHPECCLQYDDESGSYVGSEDCLYLNVHIPKKPKYNKELLPVFVYIHGGGFERGDARHVEVNRMVGKEICVCVTVQYRLGALGFLNMRSDNCRGNAGLKDQVMALRWIRDNIEPFGGNPKNVTICGESAGGSCVNFHMISPLSKGLFHKAIVQSGGIYCPWGYGGHARGIKQLFKRGCGMENVCRHAVVKLFQVQTASEFLEFSNRVFDEKIQMEPHRICVNLKPSVECIKTDAFLPEKIENLMSAATPVPTIAGITKQEVYTFYHGSAADDPVSMVKERGNFFNFLKHNLNWTDQSVTENIDTVRNIYFPSLEKLSREQILEQLAKLITDILFRRFYDHFKIGNLLESESFYVYLFDYFSGESMFDDIREDLGFHQIASDHGDDMLYLLYSWTVYESLIHIKSRNEFKRTREQVQLVSERINELWANFCRNGIPECIGVDVKWTSHTEENPCFLRISKDLEMVDGRLNERRWRIFNDICQNLEENKSLEHTPQTPEEENGPEIGQ